jgi:hypothetical protein
MQMFLGSQLASVGGPVMAAVNVEAIGMYGLLALVIGLIAWSKFSEAEPAAPYGPGGARKGELRAAAPERPVVPVEREVPPT